MRVEELGLAVGDVLQLQIGDNADMRYPVTFIGIQPGGSVIISAPRTGQDKMIFVRENQLVTLRFVAKNVASGFTSRVIATRGQPYPYLHLEIPKEIQTVEVRKEVRVTTNIPVTVINKTHNSPALAARMLNLSCSGGRVESDIKMALDDNILNITMTLDIGGIERLVTMDCEVITVKSDEIEDHYIYGLNIMEIDEDDILVLRAYIYQEILHTLHMI